MKVQDPVKKATLQIAAGTLMLTAVMLLIFTLLNQFDLTVLLGALLGAAAAIGNFFLMGLAVQKAAAKMDHVFLPPQTDDSTDDQPSADPDDQATSAKDTPGPNAEVRKVMQASYTLRMFIMVAIGALGLLLQCFHPLAVVIPMLFPRVVILLQGVIKKKEA